MAKSHQSDNPLFKALQKKYEADIAAAFAVVVVYFDNSVGIGEHPQFIEEMDKQLDVLASAEEKLTALNKHFNNTQI
jgi:hypothetical protein|tara:strand:+ start:81 stop:311 length:231 start_codon:yes stop_codon:yes gene_type:complete